MILYNYPYSSGREIIVYGNYRKKYFTDRMYDGCSGSESPIQPET